MLPLIVEKFDHGVTVRAHSLADFLERLAFLTACAFFILHEIAACCSTAIPGVASFSPTA
jgi:hypothetical protein